MTNFIWAIEVTEPPTEKRQWARPRRFIVVAPTMQDAIDLTTSRYPNITLIKVIKDRAVDEILIMGETH